MQKYFLFFLLSFPAWGNYFQPTDEDYLTTHGEGESFRFIYPPEAQELMSEQRSSVKKLEEIYRNSFNWTLDGTTNLIWASTQNQVANALATIHPTSTNVYYGGGAGEVDYFSESNWAKNLWTHELAHLYQLNPKRSFSQWTYNIFGAHPFFVYPLIPIPVFVNPNIVLPTWLVEGNAVFNESRFGNGGRLYSGRARALFFSLLKQGVLNEKRLSNNHLFFPFQEEKYIVGGYFFLYLAEKYGIDHANQFFYAHSLHYFNPLLLNTSFREHFNLSYSQMIVEFLQYYSPLAQTYTEAQEPTLARSLTHYPLNGDSQSLYFLTNPDGLSPLELNVLDKKTVQLTQRKGRFLAGKVFKRNDGKYYTVNNGLVEKNFLAYSLWGENRKDLEAYRSKVLLDTHGDDALYFDIEKSLDEPTLYYGRLEPVSQKDAPPPPPPTLLGKVNSSALFGPQKDIYYFKQEGQKRVLYKNSEKVLSYRGYYGKIVHIESDQSLYFIASTPLGSSLFHFRGDKIYRAHLSDGIIDAQIISSKKFLVVEFTAKHYAYKIINLLQKEIVQSPYDHQYFFEKDKNYQLFQNPILAAEDISHTTAAPKHYQSLHQLQYNAWNFSYQMPPQEMTSLQASFSDPLMWNTLELQYHRQNNVLESFQLEYLNQKSLLNFALNSSFNRPEKISGDNKSYFKHKLKFRYLFFKGANFWSQHGDFHIIHNQSQQEKNLFYFGYDFKYYESYSLSLFPVASFLIRPELQISANNKNFSQYALMGKSTHHLGQQFFLSSDWRFEHSQSGVLEIGKSFKDNLFLIPYQGISLHSDDPIQGARIGLSLKTLRDDSLYFPVFPVSLRRWGPEIIGNYFYFQSKSLLPEENNKFIVNLGKKNASIFEVGMGLTSELLLGHLQPLNLSLYYLTRFEDHQAGLLFNISSPF